MIIKQRLLNLLIAVDQLIWVTLTFGEGMPDETISAALYRMEREGRPSGKLLRPLVDVLFSPFERDHCKLSFESELRGTQLPPEYRQ
jgi:hypothetical protein